MKNCAYDMRPLIDKVRLGSYCFLSNFEVNFQDDLRLDQHLDAKFIILFVELRNFG